MFAHVLCPPAKHFYVHTTITVPPLTLAIRLFFRWTTFQLLRTGQPFHMDSYVDEQVFRYNNRKGKIAQRFQKLLSRVAGKRLTYAEVTGKVGGAEVF
jgi:hypothetical protein